jgi:hypothetical protein
LRWIDEHLDPLLEGRMVSCRCPRDISRIRSPSWPSRPEGCFAHVGRGARGPKRRWRDLAAQAGRKTTRVTASPPRSDVATPPRTRLSTLTGPLR